MESIDVVRKCAEAALEKKGQDVVALDLRGITPISDFFLIATASNTRQTQSICDRLEEVAEELELPRPKVEGYREGRWILVDFGAALVAHIFLAEEREYYSLERLWKDAPSEKFE
ncbi:MAG: ribosome silencing factor [Firmicutes bacterium]|nr:ribosome silencing factor [Bacillota bacterium]MBR7113459.1 ribosome silencing factor [Bacillota bacterium]